MCYTKKLTNINGADIGPKFEGRFDCNEFNCTQDGCDEGLVDGDQPKRKHFYTLSRFNRIILFLFNRIQS